MLLLTASPNSGRKRLVKIVMVKRLGFSGIPPNRPRQERDDISSLESTVIPHHPQRQPRRDANEERKNGPPLDIWGGQTVANQPDERHSFPEDFEGFLGAKPLSGCRKKKGSAFALPFSNLIPITAREFT